MRQERIAFENWLGIKPCGAAHDLAWAAWQARASLPAPQQATPGPVTLGPLAKRNIYDAIRGAYDLGYNDARNARTVPGDSAPGYKGRDVEADHGGALFNTLVRRLRNAATPEPVGEPWGWAIVDSRGVQQYMRPRVREFFGAIETADPFTDSDLNVCDRENPGIAPHHIVTLYTRPAPAQAVPMTGEWWTDVLGTAGADLLDLAKQWSDNKIHVYQFTNNAEKILKAAVLRGITAQAKEVQS